MAPPLFHLTLGGSVKPRFFNQGKPLQALQFLNDQRDLKYFSLQKTGLEIWDLLTAFVLGALVLFLCENTGSETICGDDPLLFKDFTVCLTQFHF
jgi:hypothetical protein